MSTRQRAPSGRITRFSGEVAVAEPARGACRREAAGERAGAVREAGVQRAALHERGEAGVRLGVRERDVPLWRVPATHSSSRARPCRAITRAARARREPRDQPLDRGRLPIGLEHPPLERAAVGETESPGAARGPRPGTGSLPALAAALADRLDWNWILDRARSHKVAALLATRLDYLEDGFLPNRVRDTVGTVRREARERATWAQRTLQQVARALAARSVPFLVLKGSVLAERVYGDPALRPFHDVDLAVPVPRLDEAEAAFF